MAKVEQVFNELTGRSGEADFFNASTTGIIVRQLDSNKIEDKLNGMKRIIAMMSKGESVESFFPHVVKNVITKAISLKKLVYLYLLHYADIRQNQALLSVNNFKKDLQDRNQFIRALALRVMSGIKVELIIEIVLSSVKSCSDDKSPYVKKAAALAIPKLYDQAPQLKEELIEVLEKLLNDRNTMVIGAAAYSFNKICPNNFDLLHKYYRKFCKYLVDCDEWGQSEILSMLLRYARSQFLSPFDKEALKKRKFYESEEDDFEEKEEEKSEEDDFITADLDEDHRLLIQSSIPLLRTKNIGVILQVISLLYHIAPTNEFEKVIPSFVGMINSVSREDQYIVLTNIATVANDRPELFEPYLKDFFIFFSDPLKIRKIKLKILTTLADSENVHHILQEFKTYLRFPNEKFISIVITSICNIAEKCTDVSESCIYVLMRLLSHNSSDVISDAIVATQQLIQRNPEKYKKIIHQICTLIEAIEHKEARACIVYMTGEYFEYIPKVGPDMLRIMAKNWKKESKSVKLQTLTLGTKLFLKLGEKVELLYKYILSLAKYDKNYDIRDRARFLRELVFNAKGKVNVLSANTEKIIFTEKEVKSSIDNTFFNRSKYRLGSLSHLIGQKTKGYKVLPEFATEVNQENKEKRREFDFGAALTQHMEEGGSEVGLEYNSNEEEFYNEGEEGIQFTSDESEGEWYDEGEGEFDEEGEEEGEYDDFYEEGEGEYEEGEGEYYEEGEGEYYEEGEGEYYEEGEGEYYEEETKKKGGKVGDLISFE